MDRSQSRFSQVAQKAKQKRTELDEAAAAREANRIRLDDEADAKRALEFAYELKRLQRGQGTPNFGDAKSDGDEESALDLVEDETKIDGSEASLEEYDELPTEPTADELSRIEAEALDEHLAPLTLSDRRITKPLAGSRPPSTAQARTTSL